MNMEKTECSKCRHMKLRCQGITQKKAYNIQNTTKAWNREDRNFIWFLQIQRCAQQKQSTHDSFKEHSGARIPHTTPCPYHLHKSNSFCQKNFFANDFLENALVTLHFHSPFSIAKKHSILYGKQWILNKHVWADETPCGNLHSRQQEWFLLIGVQQTE